MNALDGFPEDERRMLEEAQARARARRAALQLPSRVQHVAASVASPPFPELPAAPGWVLRELPCRGCRQTITVMGSLCGPCSDAERRETATRIVEQACRKLSRTLEPWAWADIARPEFRERVRAPKLLAFAERYQVARGSVLLLGETGVGKTTAMRALARRLIAEAIAAGDASRPITRAVWTTALDLAIEGRESRYGTRDELLHAAVRAPVLFLDELGQERADPRWLIEVTNERYDNSRPTLSSSGLRRAELEQRYGAGAVRRLIEPGGVVLNLHGDTA